MEFLDKRIRVICNELKKMSVKQTFKMSRWEYKKGNFIHPSDAAKDRNEWEVFDSDTMHWYGPDEHYWFRTSYTIPEELKNKKIMFHVRTQIDEWDDGKNPQFLLFINGDAIQGIDMNHRDVCLSNYSKGIETMEIELQAYTGTLHMEFSLITEMREVDSKIEKLYYDLWVPLEAFSRMNDDSLERKKIEYILNETINFIDFRNPYSEEFYRTIDQAIEYIDEVLYKDLAGYNDVIATCIGHTHIDVAWWWTVEQTREKVGRSFATVLKLMDEYPNYKFMSSQPQLYVFLKERYPELYEKIKARVREGRWEAEGGMWVEADCNLTSGESLVRQFIFGKKFFREEFGVDNRILWLPDVFGYSGALPQIMKKSGIDYFMTTKLAWNQFNKIPNDTMYWKGIDGSKVLAHLITTLGVGQPIKDFFTTYNGMLHPDSIMGGWKRYQNKDINNDILVSYGYGDGGGGPTREMLETSIRMEKGIKGIPKVRQEFSRNYFEELEERVKDNKRLATWEGELYFEYHRGTYTSMARNKKSNRKSEIGLMDIEFLATVNRSNISYPKNELELLWKQVLINQFHDILPGTSIKEVYDVTKKEYEVIETTIEDMKASYLNSMVDTETNEAVVIFNTLGHQRNDFVIFQDIEADVLEDELGKQYVLQTTKENKKIAFVEGLPSKGYKKFKLTNKKNTILDAKIHLDGYRMRTPFYNVQFNEQGFIEQLYDIEYEREIVQEGEMINLLRIYEDKPIYYDNWDIDIFYTEKYWDVDQVESFEWIENGPVRATVEIKRKVSRSIITQKIHFYAQHRRIDFETYVDWKESQHLLKVHFPVDVHTDEATFDIQFGNLTRKTHQNTSWDRARFESCGQKWMDLSEGHYGVSLMNDSKYGHSVHESNMALTLIKSGIEPNLRTDQEEHLFTYALYPHGGTWKEAKTVEEAYHLNVPAIVAKGRCRYDEKSYLWVDQDNIIIETIKEAEDGNGFIIRMYESENARTKAVLEINLDFEKAYTCNLIEEVEEELSVIDNKIEIVIKPYEIFSIKCI
jgi:alpha-mannosidase